jgi:hypothetical protein
MKTCHEYNHFARNFPSNKKVQENDVAQQEEGWQ